MSDIDPGALTPWKDRFSFEGRVALEELTRRIESFQLSSTNEYEYLPSFILRGMARLDLDLTPADPS